MDPLISVIVPVYKVEPFLHACVDSILRQSYKNIEVILVDDGSPDKCGKICDEYAAKDSRVIVIHQSNGGLSDARNSGLRIANGTYLYFVDSDDLLPSDSISCMYALAKKHNAQMVIGGFERFYDNGRVFFSTDEGGEYVSVFTKEEAMHDFFRDGCQAWAVLYSREVHEGILFPKGEINEDEAIVFKLLDRCRTVVVTNKVVYTYRCREGSITTSSFSVKKFAWQAHCRNNLEFIQAHYPALEPEAAARYRSSLLWSLTEIALSDNNFPNQIRELRTALKENHSLFSAAPFAYPQDKLRMVLLTYFPFQVYRTLLRIKRRL